MPRQSYRIEILMSGQMKRGFKLNIIKEICNPDEKSAICNKILRALPDWFGIEESVVDDVKQVQTIRE